MAVKVLKSVFTRIKHILFSSLLLFQGQYTKITFRSPLYVGGSPSAYWLVRATGTNRGFVGCIQSLTINNKAADIRPWPLGRALSGADIGEKTCVCVCMSLCNECYFSLAAASGIMLWYFSQVLGFIM